MTTLEEAIHTIEKLALENARLVSENSTLRGELRHTASALHILHLHIESALWPVTPQEPPK